MFTALVERIGTIDVVIRLAVLSVLLWFWLWYSSPEMCSAIESTILGTTLVARWQIIWAFVIFGNVVMIVFAVMMVLVLLTALVVLVMFVVFIVVVLMMMVVLVVREILIYTVYTSTPKTRITAKSLLCATLLVMGSWTVESFTCSDINDDRSFGSS